MSVYRFVRTTALLTLARRFRSRLLRMAFALGFALVTHWQYGDVERFLSAQLPQAVAWALLIKTLIVYAALLLCFWEVARMLRGDDGRPPSPRGVSRSRDWVERPPTAPAESAPAPRPSVLDQLAAKPHLRQRREAILARPERAAQSTASALPSETAENRAPSRGPSSASRRE